MGSNFVRCGRSSTAVRGNARIFESRRGGCGKSALTSLVAKGSELKSQADSWPVSRNSCIT